MVFYDKDQVLKTTTQTQRLFFTELPRMFGYLIFFYGLLGIGIPWRMELSQTVIWASAETSLLFGIVQGGILLLLGSFLMSAYTLRNAKYMDFGPASSFTVDWSFQVFSLVGIPLALWNVFQFILPLTGEEGAKFADERWFWILLVGGLTGFFAGRAIGGLVGLLAIWLAGKQILRQL